MNPKEDLIQRIRQGLTDRIIEQNDLHQFVDPQPTPQVFQQMPAATPDNTVTKTAKKLSAIDTLFYIAGFIMYAALMVLAFQGSEEQSLNRIFITLGAGLLIWTIVYVLSRQPTQTDTRKGLINSLVLTGSLAVISGGMITATHVGDGDSTIHTWAVFVAFLLLAGAHLAFDRLMRHIVLIVFGVILAVAAFPSFFFAVLIDQSVPADAWVLITIATGVLVAYGGKLASRSATDRNHLQPSFFSFAAFIILSAIYAAGFASPVHLLWELLLPLMIYAAFFFSIKQRNKNFLFTGSLFLVLYLITVSFRYFSGAGVAFCLILSAFSILATAFLAIRINKRYLSNETTSVNG